MPSISIHHAQIARAVGVSRSTVSRALQNHPAISESTRRKIQEMAVRMGYRPNPLLSALMASRNHPRRSDCGTLALLTAWQEKIPQSSTFRRLFKGVYSRAESAGFRVEPFWINEPRVSGKRLSQILSHRGIVGVLVGPLGKNQPSLELDWEHFSPACFTDSPSIPRLHRASAYNFQSAVTLVRKLLSQGYDRPGMVLPAHLPTYVIDQWIGGYYAGMTGALQGDLIRPLVIATPSGHELRKWCRQAKPDVILGSHADLVEWSRGSRRFMATASLDRQPANRGMAGIDQRSEEVGRAAVDLVIAQINRNERGIPAVPKTVLIEGVWVPGDSAPPISPITPGSVHTAGTA